MMHNLYGKRCVKRTLLPHNFIPGTYSVLCGRSKASTSSSGNKNLRSLIRKYLGSYSLAETKIQKSAIVSKIIDEVKEVAPDGAAFVRQAEDGRWWALGDAFAREKVGCVFRDTLHQQYRSSTKAKLARKKAEQKSTHENANLLNINSPGTNSLHQGNSPQELTKAISTKYFASTAPRLSDSTFRNIDENFLKRLQLPLPDCLEPRPIKTSAPNETTFEIYSPEKSMSSIVKSSHDRFLSMLDEADALTRIDNMSKFCHDSDDFNF